jgi:hypothetical protein
MGEDCNRLKVAARVELSKGQDTVEDRDDNDANNKCSWGLEQIQKSNGFRGYEVDTRG